MKKKLEVLFREMKNFLRKIVVRRKYEGSEDDFNKKYELNYSYFFIFFVT